MRSKRDVTIAVALGLLTFALFAQTRRFDFIQVDDPQYVQSNDRVLQGLSMDNVRWAFTTLRMSNWHPLTWLSHMLDAQLWGPGPAGPHVVNAVIHAVNGALLYAILVYLTAQPWRSAIVAALFAIHPLRIESVAWVAERKDVLSAMFFLLAIGAYALFVKRRSRGWYVATIAAMCLGMLAKPSIVTLPAVLLLLDVWPLRRAERWSKLVVEKAPLFGLSLVSCTVTFVVQRQGGAMSAVNASLPMRIANAMWAYGRYLRKTIWPSDLAAFYPYPGNVVGTTFPWSRAALSALVLIIITILALRLWRREHAVMIGWLWFLGVLVPMIGIVQVGMQSMADRYTYLPHIGLLIAIVWGVAALVETAPALRIAAVALAFISIGALAGATAYQLAYWQNGYTLFRHALDVTDHNPGANMSVAVWLTTHGRGEEAMPYYLETLRLQPNIADAHNNMGNYLRERGELRQAEQHLREAVTLSPNHAEAHHNLANVLADLGQTDAARREFNEAIRLNPDQAQFHHNFGVMLASAGRYGDALAKFERALELRPGYIDARFAYSLALIEAGRLDAAKAQFERVLGQRSDWVEAMGRFAWALATNGDPRKRDPQAAIQLADHANRRSGFANPHLLDTLAVAYASAGRFEEAVSAATRARDLAAVRQMTALAERIELRLGLYRAGQPFVATPSASNPTTKSGK